MYLAKRLEEGGPHPAGRSELSYGGGKGEQELREMKTNEGRSPVTNMTAAVPVTPPVTTEERRSEPV